MVGVRAGLGDAVARDDADLGHAEVRLDAVDERRACADRRGARRRWPRAAGGRRGRDRSDAKPPSSLDGETASVSPRLIVVSVSIGRPLASRASWPRRRRVPADERLLARQVRDRGGAARVRSAAAGGGAGCLRVSRGLRERAHRPTQRACPRRQGVGRGVRSRIVAAGWRAGSATDVGDGAGEVEADLAGVDPGRIQRLAVQAVHDERCPRRRGATSRRWLRVQRLRDAAVEHAAHARWAGRRRRRRRRR